MTQEKASKITIDQLAGMMNTAFQALDTKMDKGFNRIDQRFDNIEERLERIEHKIN